MFIRWRPVCHRTIFGSNNVELASSLSQQDEVLLSAWLNSAETPNNTFSLMATKGFLFALVCAPKPIETDVWLSQILGGELPADIAEDKLFALITLHNQIGNQVYEEGMKLPKQLEFSAGCEANFLAGHPLHEWCLGFAVGSGFYAQDLMDALPEDEDLFEAFSMAYMTLSFFASKANAEAIAEFQDNGDLQTFSQEMYGLMPDFSLGFAALVEEAALASGLIAEDDWDEEGDADDSQ
nr:YecA family protein [Motilimonas cestriensis]